MTGKYSSPSGDLLRDPIQRLANNSEDVRKMDALHAVFDLMGFSAEVKRIVHGPQATQFAICIADGINVNKLASKQDQIAAVMGVDKIYIQIPIPGTSLIGIEVPNSQRDTIYLKDLLLDDTYQSSSSPTNICIGKTLPGEPIYCEITDLPHVLVAGKRDSGKSTFLRSVILNLLFRASPEQVRLLLIDPTDKEFEAYKLLPHLAAPVITDAQKGIAALAWVIKEMSWRYQLFQQAMVRNISGYNRKMDDPIKALPFLIVIISELGLLMEADRKRTEAAIQRLAALGRAAGIHLFYATNSMSVDVITGVVKANTPSRIAFEVNDKYESRTVLDVPGAENLIGLGDMLYFPRSEFRPIRVQGCYVSQEEALRVIQDVQVKNTPRPYLLPKDALPLAEDVDRALGLIKTEEEKEQTDEEYLQRAAQIAVEADTVSTSKLRRRIGIGVSRASRCIDKLVEIGLICPIKDSDEYAVNHAEAEEILAALEEELSKDQ